MDLANAERKLIQDTYDRGSGLIQELGRGISWVPESIETVLSIERHRWFWRPARVRLLLVAESHVYTSCDENKLLSEECPGLSPEDCGRIPREYVKLVYCLAYGERELLPMRKAGFRSSGTIQYWDLFGQLTGCGRQLRRSEGSMVKRLEKKVETLKELRVRGIWLMDSSVHAICRTCTKQEVRRIPKSCVSQLHDHWWNGYGEETVRSLMKNNNKLVVWIIGRGPWNALKNKIPGYDPRNFIYQPNARIRDDDALERLKRAADAA